MRAETEFNRAHDTDVETVAVRPNVLRNVNGDIAVGLLAPDGRSIVVFMDAPEAAGLALRILQEVTQC